MSDTPVAQTIILLMSPAITAVAVYLIKRYMDKTDEAIQKVESYAHETGRKIDKLHEDIYNKISHQNHMIGEMSDITRESGNETRAITLKIKEEMVDQMNMANRDALDLRTATNSIKMLITNTNAELKKNTVEYQELKKDAKESYGRIIWVMNEIKTYSDRFKDIAKLFRHYDNKIEEIKKK